MGKRRRSGVAAGLDPIAKLIYRSLRRRGTAAADTEHEKYRDDQRACKEKRCTSGVRVMTNDSCLVDGEPIR